MALALASVVIHASCQLRIIMVTNNSEADAQNCRFSLVRSWGELRGSRMQGSRPRCHALPTSKSRTIDHAVTRTETPLAGLSDPRVSAKASLVSSPSSRGVERR